MAVAERSKLGLMISFRNTAIGAGVALERRAEEAGFDSVWVPEFYRSYSVTLAAIAASTERIKLGTNVVMGFNRSSYLGARVAADLDELSGGRLILGVGTGVLHPGRSDGWSPARSRSRLPELRDLVDIYRHCWQAWYDTPGTDLHFEPDHGIVHIDRSPLENCPMSRAVPIHLGVRKSRALQLAGEVADGVVLFSVASPRFVEEEVRPNLAIGAERAGRDLAALEVTAMVVCCVSPDRNEARRLARWQLAYDSVRGGSVHMGARERDGFGEAWKCVREARAKDDTLAMEAAISDEMLDFYALSGHAEEVQERLRALDSHNETIVLAALEWWLDQDQIITASSRPLPSPRRSSARTGRASAENTFSMACLHSGRASRVEQGIRATRSGGPS